MIFIPNFIPPTCSSGCTWGYSIGAAIGIIIYGVLIVMILRDWKKFEKDMHNDR